MLGGLDLRCISKCSEYLAICETALLFLLLSCSSDPKGADGWTAFEATDLGTRVKGILAPVLGADFECESISWQSSDLTPKQIFECRAEHVLDDAAMLEMIAAAGREAFFVGSKIGKHERRIVFRDALSSAHVQVWDRDERTMIHLVDMPCIGD